VGTDEKVFGGNDLARIIESQALGCLRNRGRERLFIVCVREFG